MTHLRPFTARQLAVAAVACALWLAPASAQAQITFEFFMGSAVNLHTPLTIEQEGYPDISFNAHYSVRPLADRMYYAARLGFWKKDADAGWLIELLHHKLYLENPPPDVQHFEVTHGYNMLTFNRGWRRGQWMFLAGGGIVVPHTNSEVRGLGRSIDAPYTLAGVAFQGAANRRFDLAQWLFVSVEGKVTAAYARVPVAQGRATTPNVAFHGLAGVGLSF
jgi:hypothetical protein